MAMDEKLAARVRALLAARRDVREKRMFGGLSFLVKGNMCCGVNGDDLMVRVGPDAYEGALALSHARVMDFTGKPLRGFVFVAREGVARKRDLERWVQRGLDFAGALPAKK